MNINDLSEVLAYDPFSGALFWRKDVSMSVKGITVAGSITSRGYRNVLYKRKSYKAHRIAWSIYYGKEPKGHVDHIDGNKDNNRIDNLRVVTEKLNQQNRPCHREGTLWGTSKVQGGKYYSSRVYGKYLENFKTMQEANERAVAYAKENNFPLLGDN